MDAFLDPYGPRRENLRHVEIPAVEFRDPREPLPVGHLDGMVGLRQHVEAPQGLNRAIDVNDGEAHRVGDVNLSNRHERAGDSDRLPSRELLAEQVRHSLDG